MTKHGVLVGFRLCLIALADELGNVSAACRPMGVQPLELLTGSGAGSTLGLEALGVR